MLPRKISDLTKFPLVSILAPGLMDQLDINLVQNLLAIEGTQIRQILGNRFAKLDGEHVSHLDSGYGFRLSLSSSLL